MLEASKWFTNEGEVKELGIKVLKLPKDVVRTAIYNHRHNINDASFDVLSTWRKQQAMEQEAFTHLYTQLKKNKMNELAAQLEKLANESDGQVSSEKGRFLLPPAAE